RADVVPSFVQAHHLVYRIATPVVLPYAYAGDDGLSTERDYLPDYVGVLATGDPFLAEAGPAGAKSSSDERAKAESARTEMERRGGAFFLITGLALNETRFGNYALLRAHFPMPEGFEVVIREIRQLLGGPDPVSINWIGRRLGRQFEDEVVHAAAWRAL